MTSFTLSCGPARSGRGGRGLRAALRVTLGAGLLLVTAGAIAGVGRTPGSFAVTATGSASYSIAIQVPPGAHGMQPHLAITYDSRAQNGPLGVGWALGGLSVIQRCRSTLAQDNATDSPSWQATDHYCLDGAKLRLTGGTYGQANSTYQTEVDEFSRITAVNNSTSGRGPDHFIAQGRDGLTYEYGNSSASRDLVSAPSIWALDKVTDRAGNYMSITYANHSVPTSDWILPLTITYANNDGTGTAGASTISFVWNPRSSGDIISSMPTSGAANGALRSALLLSEIDISESGTIIREYKLTYNNGAATGRTRLAQVQQCDGAGSCFGPTVITWQNGAAGFGTDQVVANLGSLAASAIPLDLNGDGRTDLVFPSGNNWGYMLANASGGYNPPVITTTPHNGKYGSAIIVDYYANGIKELLVPDANNNWSLLQLSGSSLTSTTLSVGGAPLPATTQAWVGDVNGDGYQDLVYVSANSTQLLGRFNSASGFSSTVSTLYTAPAGTTLFLYTTTMSFGVQSTLNQGDFNGDGRTDLLVNFIGTGPKMLLSTGTGYVDSGIVFSDTNPSIVGTTWRPLDANGDGVDDLAFVDSSGQWKVLYGVPAAPGAASLGTAVTSAITSPAAAGGTAVLPVDYDGDGRIDIMAALTSPSPGGDWQVVHATGDSVPAAQGGQGAFTGSTATNTGIITAQMGTWVVDVNGDGLPDLVYADTSGNWHLLLHNGPATDLVTGVTDGFNNSVQITYAALTDPTVYTEGTGASYPLQELLLPLYVVKQFIQSDGIGGNYSINETYSTARADLSGRGFLGFGTRTELDSRTGISTTWTYRQDFPFIGEVAGIVARQSSGTGPVISQSSNTWTPLELDSTANNQRWAAQLTGVSTQRYEVGGSLNGQLIGSYTDSYTYDSYGNATTVTSTAVDRDSTSPYVNQSWTTTTTNTPDVDTTNWCLPLFTESQVAYTASNDGPAVTRTKQFTPDTVHCRYTEVVTEPSSTAYKVTEDLGYDSFGNVTTDMVTGLNMSARTTTVNWGSTGRYKMSVIDPSLAPATQYNYKFAFGTVINMTDSNGVLTSWTYDTFGRKIQENRPDGTYTTWVYNDCATSGCLIGAHGLAVTHTVFGVGGGVQTDGTDYFDQVDRPLVSNERMLVGGSYDRKEMRYDNQGRTVQQGIPCTWSALTTPCPFFETRQYDVLDRITESQRPTSSTNTSPQTTMYTYEGRTTLVTDANGHTRTLVNDVNGRLRHTHDAEGYTVVLAYDAAGSKNSTMDSLGNALWSGTYQYGSGAFLVAETDADRGAWSYGYDALGERTSWTDPKGQQFAESYDALSRPLTRSEPDLFTQWTWGTSASAHEIGQLHSLCTGTGSNPTNCTTAPGYAESEIYDSVDRLAQRTIQIPGDATYTYTWAYNPTSELLDTLTYPTNASGYALQLKYGYANGILQTVTDVSDTPNVTFWTANANNPRGQVTQETLGNGVVVNHNFDAVTGWVGGITAGVGGGASLQNNAYLFDDVGNLTQRQDNNLSLTENIYPDVLNRIDHTTLVGGGYNGTNLALTYDLTGNILTSQLEGGTTATQNFSTNQSGCTAYSNPQPHALRSSTKGSQVTSFCYDANGNVVKISISGIPAATATWTSYNQPASLSALTGASSQFSYDGNHQRYKQAAVLSAGVSETTIYVGSLLEKVMNSNGIAYRYYVPIGNSEVVYNRWSSGTNSVYYLTMDHLGSTASVMDSSGNVVVKENFAAGGARRGDSWTGKPTTAELTTIDGVTHRGFTFQERLDNLSLTNFNGRIYGETGQFFSPDPYMGDPSDTQSYNRYSYTLNNPLSRTDPTGYFSLGDLLNPFSNKNPLNPFSHEGRLIALAPFDPHAGNTLLREHPWLQMVAEIAACEYGGPYACGATSAYMTRLDGGDWLQTFEAGYFSFAFYDWDAGMDDTAGPWWGKALLRGYMSAALSGVEGGNLVRGFEYGFAGSALNSIYLHWARHEPDWAPGQSFTTPGLPCSNPLSNCYDPVMPGGYIPEEDWTKNTWGGDQELNGHFRHDFALQSGPLSLVMDEVPGMQAVSQVHDPWMWNLPDWLNYPTMPVAAFVTYGALIGKNVYNITPWLNVRLPYRGN